MKPRVCVLNPNYYRSSGVTIVIKRLYEEGKNAVSWGFVTCGYGKEALEEDPGLIGLTFGPRRINVMTLNPLVFLWNLWMLVTYIVDNNFRVLHVHHRRLLVIAWMVRCVTGVRVVYTGQLTYKKTNILRPFAIDVAVGISDAVMNDIRTSVSADRYTKIGNPAAFDRNQTVGNLKDDSPTVITIARLAPVKNHEYLLDSWRYVIREIPNATLLLVGEGELKAQLESQAAALGVSDSVKFLGYLADWRSIAATCRFAILPSLVEGHPVAVIEAAALKLPTLVTDVDGSRDTVPPLAKLKNRVPLNNPVLFAEYITDWLKQPQMVCAEGECYYDYHGALNSSAAVFSRYLKDCWSPAGATII